MLLTADEIVTGAEILRPGWIDLDRDRVLAAGTGAPPRTPDRVLAGRRIVPGFVDMHCHGGGGGDFPGADRESALLAIATHRARGTTTLLGSLVTASPADLLAGVRVLADLVDDGELAGIHLEGPWISRARAGAHNPAWLRPPDPVEVAALLTAGRGAIRMVTIAPELPGALDTVAALVEQNVVVAVGHTDADYDVVRAAIAAGATVGTHLFNAMRPLRHRRPGPVLALLENPEVTVELIADGVHLDRALYHWVSQVHPRAALVTDAMAAAGMPDGDYSLGPMEVTVADGVARLAGTDTIAGSTGTMDRMFAHALEFSGPGDDALATVVAQSSGNPAAALRLAGVGDLTPGRRADLVVLNGSQVTGVLRAGAWVLEPAGR